jgi:hypothetical protein
MNVENQQAINKRLTYAIGADKGGWDLTQVLRLPGTPNHKYKNVTVKDAHVNGHNPLPAAMVGRLKEFKADEPGRVTLTTDPIPRSADVLRKVRRRLSPRARALLRAKRSDASIGTRSDRLWELECLLAEANLSEAEIVGLTRDSAWNKFKGRHDEVKRLRVGAAKAKRHTGGGETIEDNDEADGGDEGPDDDGYPIPQAWSAFDRDHTAIEWLIAEVWGRSEVGFISGHPKAYKSWVALDLAVSVATGTRFLNSFQAKKGNVLLIQEEDPKPVLQQRLCQIAGSKGLISAEAINDNEIEMRYDLPDNLYIHSNAGFLITDEGWMEELADWVRKLDIDLVIIDPLMMVADVSDEFKLFSMMTEVFKPVKRLRAETGTAIAVVHHHTKGEQTGAKAMYGSVASWAWEEVALHLNHVKPGNVAIERFSKHAKYPDVTMTIGDINEDGWRPEVIKGQPTKDEEEMLLLIEDRGGVTSSELADHLGINRAAAGRRLAKLEKAGRLTKSTSVGGGRGRSRAIWKTKGVRDDDTPS